MAFRKIIYVFVPLIILSCIVFFLLPSSAEAYSACVTSFPCQGWPHTDCTTYNFDECCDCCEYGYGSCTSPAPICVNHVRFEHTFGCVGTCGYSSSQSSMSYCGTECEATIVGTTCTYPTGGICQFGTCGSCNYQTCNFCNLCSNNKYPVGASCLSITGCIGGICQCVKGSCGAQCNQDGSGCSSGEVCDTSTCTCIGSCTGFIKLQLSDSEAYTSESVTATASGMSGCGGKTVKFRAGSGCSSSQELLASCTYVSDSGCSKSFAAPCTPDDGAGRYISACIDRGDGTTDSDQEILKSKCKEANDCCWEQQGYARVCDNGICSEGGSVGCTSPTGDEGDYTCHSGDVDKCVGGYWDKVNDCYDYPGYTTPCAVEDVIRSTESAAVQDCSIATGDCTDPTGDEGDYTCHSGDVDKCVGGYWDKVNDCYDYPGYTTPCAVEDVIRSTESAAVQDCTVETITTTTTPVTTSTTTVPGECYPQCHSSHCDSPDCLCDSGHGDCDLDSDCKSGLICCDDVGDHFGCSEGTDICLDNEDCEYYKTTTTTTLPGTTTTTTTVPPDCHGSTQLWDWGYCTPSCKCYAGEGDCGSDEDCHTGYCAMNVGTKYGQVSSMDVCENIDTTTTTIISSTTTSTVPDERPDLIVEGIWREGNTFKYIIENVGNVDVEDSIMTCLYVDDFRKATDSLPPFLEVDGSISGSFDSYTWDCTESSDVVKVYTDCFDSIDEIYDTNNNKSVTWSCSTLSTIPETTTTTTTTPTTTTTTIPKTCIYDSDCPSEIVEYCDDTGRACTSIIIYKCYNNKCIPFEEGVECVTCPYYCEDGECVEEKCDDCESGDVDQSLIQRIINWFKRLFGV